MNDCCFKGSSMGLKVHTNVKQLPGSLETGESQLPGTLDTGESQLPGVQSNGESFYCLYNKNVVLILICELSIWNFHRF